MAEAWIYIDESQGPEPAAVEPATPFWLAALITRYPIDERFTTAAMATLAADPDASGNEMDRRTLARGHFHASVDSKNAHSALCRAIVGQGLGARLSASQWFFDRDDSEDFQGARLHRLTALLSATSTFQRDYDAVHLSIARRAGSFEDHHAKDWLDYCRQTELFALLSNPVLPVRFPHLTVDVVGPEAPGIQVCDFILWAIQRAKPHGITPMGDTAWLTRLGLRISQAGGAVAGAHQELVAELGTWERRDVLPAFGPFRAPEDLSDVARFELLEEIVVNVRTAAALAPTSPRIRHLAGELSQAVGDLTHLRAGPPRAGEAAHALMRAFLLVCDTLPIYEMSDAVAYARACEKRGLAAAFLTGKVRLWMPLDTSV